MNVKNTHPYRQAWRILRVCIARGRWRDGNFDVVGLLPSGKLVKIEVKTCSAPRRRDRNYGFGINKGSPDVYALYAFDLGVVVFEPAENMRALTYVSRSRSHFTQEAQEASLKALLDF